ncbi:MAG: fibronectin type III domain-containing protein [Acidimicrobiales bacterium]
MNLSVVRHGIIQTVALASLAASALIASSAGAAPGAPSAPRAVHASGTATSITVKWAAPASRGASAIREYVVTSHPSSRTCATRSTRCVVAGLKPGSSYTFTVVAKNSSGAGSPGSSNRVTVDKPSVYFLAALNTFNNASTVAETALGNASTSAQEKQELNKLSGSFASFVSALSLEKWPSASAADMASFVADTRQLAAETITSLQATTTLSADLDVLQGETNKEILAEASIFSDLGLASPVIASNATTPTPVALDTTQTVTDFFGDQLSVTATQIVDPATAAAGSGLPDSGYRFVAVEMNLANPATSSTVDGDANFSTSVIGSDGQTYTADYGTVAGCTNFDAGYFALPPSDNASGCVVFELPMSVTVKTVEFSLAAGYLDAGAWS